MRHWSVLPGVAITPLADKPNFGVHEKVPKNIFKLGGPMKPLLLAFLLPTIAVAQWINYPTPGTPRLPDGKPNLSAPAPRAADGKPDLSGVWRGAGPLYRFNIAQDLKPEDVPYQPWAEAPEGCRPRRAIPPARRCKRPRAPCRSDVSSSNRGHNRGDCHTTLEKRQTKFHPLLHQKRGGIV